ncbi:MAG: DUF3090 domain-containing protein [Chloroflexi bacterium]|nr:DUF3090 domain-containing protein [Chloroflexota bacterium]
MASPMFELNPVLRIAVGALGRPGERLFLLQASTSEQTVTLKLEKEQVYALARGIDELLEILEQQEVIATPSGEPVAADELDLEAPLEQAFAVSQMGLAFDRAVGLLVLVLAEGVSTEEEEADEEAAGTARLWATPAQMRALSRHAREVVAAGRPACPLCGRPMGPGHACEGGNGHGAAILD